MFPFNLKRFVVFPKVLLFLHGNSPNIFPFKLKTFVISYCCLNKISEKEQLPTEKVKLRLPCKFQDDFNLRKAFSYAFVSLISRTKWMPVLDIKRDECLKFFLSLLSLKNVSPTDALSCSKVWQPFLSGLLVHCKPQNEYWYSYR